jgi:two-component system cell cycle sensor histidine kinase/response regulator CckA
LTRQLLAYARKQKTRPEVVDINATVSRMISMLRRLIGENIELKWKPARSLWPVMLDPTHLDQILTNLVVNARDAIEGSGSIVIETRRSSLEETICARIPGAVPGDYVRISVTDTGKGMDKGTLARVFEPFFTTKDIGHGSGLGLSTVYGTVKQNAGFIEVFSAPRSGATFDVYLPRHTGEEVASARDEAPPAVLPGGTETILVVEDEPRLLELTVKVLRSDGYTVLGAPGPQEALNLAAGLAGEIHLLVTDVVMPVMSGPQLRDQLVSSRSSLRTIFMSGYAADKIAPQETEKAGFLFLQKPFTVDELRALVRSVLELAR